MKILDDTGLAYFWSKIKAWCSALFALDSNVVHLSGNETITGIKTYNFDGVYTRSKYINLVKGVTPTPNSVYSIHEFLDKNGERLGYIGHSYNNVGNNNLTLCVRKQTDTTEASIGIGWNNDGTPHSWAPVPDNSSNSEEIATTSFVKSQGYLTSHQPLPTLSKTDSGSGNAVTDISVSDHAITVTKGTTFAVDSNVVHLSGSETIASGIKTFRERIQHVPLLGGDPFALMLRPTSSDFPNGTYYSVAAIVDTDTSFGNRYYGFIRSYPNGTSSPASKNLMQITATASNAANTSSTWSSLIAGVDNDDIPFATAPATSTTRTNAYDIVTRGFIADDTRIVHTTGDEQISGMKTFYSSTHVSHNSAGAGFMIKQRGIERGGTWKDQRGHFAYYDKNNNALVDLCNYTYTNSNDVKFNTLQFVLYSYADTTSAIMIVFTAANWTSFSFAPNAAADNTIYLGASNCRWKQLFAGTATINTSDERCKDSIADIPDAVLDAWLNVRWRQFRFADAVEEKGDAARLHSGTVAQDIQRVFSAAGLDASRYGLFCYDRWDAEPEQTDENGRVVSKAHPAGDRYSLRYEEALCMEAACMRRENARLKKRVADLEDRLAALELRLGSE